MASRKTITKTVREKTIATTSRNPQASRLPSRMPQPLAHSTALGPRTSIPRPNASSGIDSVYRAGPSGQSLRPTSGIPSRLSAPTGTAVRSGLKPPSARVPQTISKTSITRSNVSIPSGHYMIPSKRGSTMQGGKQVILSSPPNLRQQLEQKPPLAIQTFSSVAQPGTYGASRSFLSHPVYEDTQSANVYVNQASPKRYGPSTREQSYYDPANSSFMNYRLDPSEAIDFFSDEDLDTSPQLLSPSARTPPHLRGAEEEPFDYSLQLSSPGSSLEKLVEEELERSVSEHPNSSRRIQGRRSRSASPPTIMSPEGPVQATKQITVGHTVSRLPEAEIVNRHASKIETDRSGRAYETEYDVQQFEPGGLNASRRGDLSAPLKDVVSVTSSITIAPGVTTRTDKAIYQKFNNPEQISPADVLKMIEEENDDIELMKDVAPLDLKGSFTESFDLKKRIQKAKLFPDSVKRLEQAVIHHPPSEKTQEELHPEVMASLMYTEEQRILMEEEPLNVCNFLFPPGHDDLVVEVSSAAQAPLQNIVVPGEIPSELHTSGVTPELQTVAGATLESQKEHPTGDLYTAAMLQQRTPKRTAPRIARSPVKEYPIFLDNEEPPFEMEDIQPMIDLVGASPSATMTTEFADTSQPHEEADENALEYELTPQPPSHVSRVQLRGSQKPPWFPGYVVALPQNLKMAKSVSDVLPAAWQAVQPDIFEEDSIVVVG